MSKTFTNGSRVSFLPGPRSSTRVTATVTGQEGAFLVTKDDAGKVRKVRPGSCAAA